MNLMDAHSPVDIHAQEDHLRRLLDQRATRADIHGRFSSFSEASDSPSVYSHARFSPRPADSGSRTELEVSTNSIRSSSRSTAHRRGPSSEPRSPMSDRERLRNPDASGLDFEDDPQSSYSSGDALGEEDDVPTDDAVGNVSRLSIYGPKMRFHSRAPWEAGEDEESEQDEQPVPTTSNKRSKKRKSEKSDVPKKSWTLPRASGDTRPSIDSVRSQAKSKQSLDSPTTFSSNGGALLALAQASMSSTSLALTPPQTSLRDKLSISRLRSRTPSSSNVSSDPPETRTSSRSETTSPTTRSAPLISSVDTDTYSNDIPSFLARPSSRASSPHTPQHQEYTHPYANPDIRPVAYDDQRTSPRHAQTATADQCDTTVGRSDSSATLTDSATSNSIPQSRSAIPLTPGSSSTLVQTSTSANMSSMSDSSPQNRGGLQGKGISAPIPLNKTVLHPIAANMVPTASIGSPRTGSNPHIPIRNDVKLQGLSVNGFPGWNENPTSPSIKLISLEEAQAQARERSRSANGVITGSPSGHVLLQSQNTDAESQSSSSRSRVRSTSASGAKARAAMEFERPGQSVPSGEVSRQPFPGGSVPAKVVSRKKSGFMRLFNAKERERAMENWPPVPSMSTDALTGASTSSVLATPPLPRSRQVSSHRVPVPSLSPSMIADERSGSSSSNEYPPISSTAATAPASERERPRERQLSARRNVPDLSIVTHSPSLPSKSYSNPPLSAVSDMTHAGYAITPAPSSSEPDRLGVIMPSSAPPSAPDFVALSLRPVSSLFGPGFAAHLVPPDTLSPEDSRASFDISTPTTGTSMTAISPLSPEFTVKLGSIVGDGDQASLVHALQEQINSARKAWQRHVWELEGQVRDLKAEVEELRAVEDSKEYCAHCGRGPRQTSDASEHIEDLKRAGVKIGVVNRPRARTGVGSRFASGT